MDFNIKLNNGQVLRGMIQIPEENLKAVIIFVHGIGEHIHRYDHWAELFNKGGIGFTGVDLPGHGRSDGNRGDIKSYGLLGEMLDIFAGSLASAKYSLAHASELKIPVLLLHGSDNLLTSPEGSREFAGKTNMAELKIWNGGYHELHNELFKDEVFKYIMDWIKK